MDGPSGDEEATSTTPKSGRAKDPDEYGRLMGVSSVDLSGEEDGFGDGELTDTQEQDEEVANDLILWILTLVVETVLVVLTRGETGVLVLQKSSTACLTFRPCCLCLWEQLRY